MPVPILRAAFAPAFNHTVRAAGASRSGGIMMVEKMAFAVASGAMAALAAVFVGFVVETAAPEPQVGPEGRVPAWVEQERGS